MSFVNAVSRSTAVVMASLSRTVIDVGEKLVTRPAIVFACALAAASPKAAANAARGAIFFNMVVLPVPARRRRHETVSQRTVTLRGERALDAKVAEQNPEVGWSS